MAHTWIHRFSIFTAVSTFVLIFIGGLVTSTGSGLSVPDWPTTYGENMFTYPIDKWIGGIKYEHGHRLFASFVGFLTIILAVWLALKEDRRWVKIAGFVALGLVIFQGVLGGLTVLFLLPTPISVAHGMLAQSFFCLVSAIALFTSEWWRSEIVVIKKKEGYFLQLLAFAATIFLFIQLGFGALLRHTYSGMAVPDFPLAFGQLFPSLDPDSILQYNQELIRDGIKWPGDRMIAPYQIIIHLVHRYWAFVVATVVGFAGFKIYRSVFLPDSVRRNGKILIAAVVIQFLLGMFTVLTRKEVIITTAHVALGAFTLVISVITLLQLMRVFGFRFTRIHFSD
ncbi:MAG: COX15/CtaA family protein [Ignavibacteriales bacterium]|nr:COX15/CtaA family protein [Ignavibacteriales bacterium]